MDATVGVGFGERAEDDALQLLSLSLALAGWGRMRCLRGCWRVGEYGSDGDRAAEVSE